MSVRARALPALLLLLSACREDGRVQDLRDLAAAVCVCKTAECAAGHTSDIHFRRWLEQEDHANLDAATLDAMISSLSEAAVCHAQFFPETGLIELTLP